MYRLIPSRYSEAGTVLEEVAGDEATLVDAARLDSATNERVQGELYGLNGISLKTAVARQKGRCLEELLWSMRSDSCHDIFQKGLPPVGCGRLLRNSSYMA
jgi:hypothetical protein